MYNRIIKKFYIIKLFSFSLPQSKYVRKNSFYLCKFFLKQTPYGNILVFIKELQKILFINNNTFEFQKMLFLCSNRIYFKNINCKSYKMNKVFKKTNKILPSNKIISFFILCSNSYTYRQISFLKDKKIPSIGFLNYNNIPNITDYTLLLESKYFASVFLLNYFINKLTKNVSY